MSLTKHEEYSAQENKDIDEHETIFVWKEDIGTETKSPLSFRQNKKSCERIFVDENCWRSEACSTKKINGELLYISFCSGKAPKKELFSNEITFKIRLFWQNWSLKMILTKLKQKRLLSPETLLISPKITPFPWKETFF